MVCPACGFANGEGARFCGECGVALASRCPGCGAAQGSGQRFCDQCGLALTGVPASVERAAEPRAPVAPELRFVSVLFRRFGWVHFVVRGA